MSRAAWVINCCERSSGQKWHGCFRWVPNYSSRLLGNLAKGRQASPSDAIAILAVKDQLRLTAAQTPQLGDINAEARGKAVVVLKQ